ncbi:hypothetical protein EJ08DRAFT_689463 [Tothia fuscella]|uniref:Uncharacterized protein n=1 Tax=Tothia fuscella TaxID=1048955 RepID=A0A9P4NJX2_9PEZI|nr:hypothetical protein EJ08DRAFT_689463 [Tothia fuscella]
MHFPWIQRCSFTSTPTLLKRQKGGPKRDTRILLIRYFLHAPRTPRPLRLSRMRALRHWTIHRAYQLHKETLRKEQELELERMYYEMRKACEQLRTIGRDGLEGVEEEGKLFRVAMEKKGVWGGVPIEYARAQTEWPSREGWNSGWTWD